MATTTPNIGLNKPAYKDSRWDIKNNENFDILDRIIDKSGSDMRKLEQDLKNAPFVKLDGTTQMKSGYIPTKPLDVVTKGFVDAKQTIYAALSKSEINLPNPMLKKVPYVLKKYGSGLAKGMDNNKTKGTITVLTTGNYLVSVDIILSRKAVSTTGYLMVHVLINGVEEDLNQASTQMADETYAQSTFTRIWPFNAGDVLSLQVKWLTTPSTALTRMADSAISIIKM